MEDVVPMRAKNPLRLSLSLFSLVLLLAACGTTTEDSATATVSNTTILSTATGSDATLTSTTATANPFAEAVLGTRTQLPASLETIVVELEGESWTFPAAVYLRTEEDAEIVLAAAKQKVATVHNLVAPLISGWPSTTWRPYTEEELADRQRYLRTAGVTAVTLAGLVGKQAALEQAWVDYEQSFADPDQGWGPPDIISSEVVSWKAEAQALTEAIDAQRPAE